MFAAISPQMRLHNGMIPPHNYTGDLTKIVVNIVVMACDWIARIRTKKRAIIVILCYFTVFCGDNI